MNQSYTLANDFSSRSYNLGHDIDQDGLLDVSYLIKSLQIYFKEDLLSSMRDIAHNISKVADDEIDIYFKTIL